VSSLAELLDATAALHHHLCPRQILGVRMGLLAGEVLGLDLPQTDKRLFVMAETDGCGTDGLSVATNCWIGRRTLRVEDYGKLAATFVDTQTGRAIRIVPRRTAREAARAYAPDARNKWAAQLSGYPLMPAAELLSVQTVQLNTPIEDIIGRPGIKAVCEICGEEIINQREIVQANTMLCRSCAGPSYYRLVADFACAPAMMATLASPA
jgi:formylmethanofuran dehydrogenase subunit E